MEDYGAGWQMLEFAAKRRSRFSTCRDERCSGPGHGLSQTTNILEVVAVLMASALWNSMNENNLSSACSDKAPRGWQTGSAICRTACHGGYAGVTVRLQGRLR